MWREHVMGTSTDFKYEQYPHPSKEVSAKHTNKYIIHIFRKIKIQSSPIIFHIIQPASWLKKMLLHSIWTCRPLIHSLSPPAQPPPTWRKLLGTFHAKTLLPWHQKWSVFCGRSTHQTQLFRFWGRLILSSKQWCTYLYVYIRYAWIFKLSVSLTISWNLWKTNLEPVSDDVQS